MSTVDLDMFEAEIAKQYGKEALTNFGDQASFGTVGTFIPTSSESLNRAIGIGGVPRGRVIEIFGMESSGKTTLALDIIANCQRMFPELPVYYGDAENAMNPDLARTLGVNLSKERFKMSQEAETETALDIMYKAALRGFPLMVLDSVAALTLKSDMESDSSTDSRVAGNSKAMRAHLRNIIPVLTKTNGTAIYINHITYKVGPSAGYGNPETTPGGKGLPFFASLRMDVRIAEKKVDKSTGEFLGIRSRVSCVKNKVASPYKKAEYDVLFGYGIDKASDLVQVATDTGVLTKAGTWLKFGEQKWQGAAQTAQAFKDDEALSQQIREAVWAQ